jgi:predicted RNA binding protein YcfA (HicA-like mRNA interferase family)
MEKSTSLTYKILLHKEPEGSYTVTVPALPGCVTYGDNVDHAIIMAKEAVELYIAELKGYVFRRSNGSHQIYYHPQKKKLIVVPVHGNRDLPKGTFLAILKQAGLTKADFEEEV